MLNEKFFFTYFYLVYEDDDKILNKINNIMVNKNISSGHLLGDF